MSKRELKHTASGEGRKARQPIRVELVRKRRGGRSRVVGNHLAAEVVGSVKKGERVFDGVEVSKSRKAVESVSREGVDPRVRIKNRSIAISQVAPAGGTDPSTGATDPRATVSRGPPISNRIQTGTVVGGRLPSRISRKPAELLGGSRNR